MTDPTPQRRPRSRLRPGAIDLARAQYVEGEASVRRIAEELGIPRRTLERVAGEEGWSARREAHRAEAAERRRQASLEAHAREATTTAARLARASAQVVEVLEERVGLLAAQTVLLREAARDGTLDPRTLVGSADVKAIAEAVDKIRSLQVAAPERDDEIPTAQAAQRWWRRTVRIMGPDLAREVLEAGADEPDPAESDEASEE
jgi:hypothetical protein